ncbi:MAG TPA: primosomal protein N' [Vicinamibacterales bacterium]|nr:primosomal protein N' [Vicinamibacterales bacterium]
MTQRLVSVAVPVPGLGVLTYQVPDEVPVPPKGARVVVPLGARTVTGCVVDTGGEAPAGATLRDLIEVLDIEPFLPADVIDLALWVGEYYLAGAGAALAVAMPPSARRGRASAFRTERVAVLVGGATPAPVPRGVRQQAALARLSARAGPVAIRELAEAGVSSATVASLERLGLVAVRTEVRERDPFVVEGGREAAWSLSRDAERGRALTSEQETVLAALDDAAHEGTYGTVLLHGVTGSGKTELYLRLAERIMQAGRRVLMLVPEIALTPAVAGLLYAWFGRRVAIQHSGLSAGERHDQWHRIRRGEVDFVIGTRSAVFAPLAALGLIIVDEEHESSYKQDETPRYHGRDVAVMRGRMAGALVVLGSATPSMESAANARDGRYRMARLTRRVLDRPLATTRIVDMRREYAARGPDVTLSTTLVEAIQARLERGEQSLVLLNRRGFATVIFCRECAASLECPHCSVTLTYHRTARRVRCHYCNYAAAVPGRCGVCRGEYLEQSGFGTERLEADVRAVFPTARVARVDRDTVRRRGAIARVLRAVAAGQLDIVVGTQMIAKGHDFPAVTLVGVVLADVGLGLADFRASERTFQLLTQVVGRAGRGETPGEAVIQTLYPDHYSIRAAAAQDYASFFDREMAFRTGLEYPPAMALINIVVTGRSADAALGDAGDLVRRVRRAGLPGRVIGPAPAPLAKIKDAHRAQFFVKGRDRRRMREAVTRALAERVDLRRRVTVDVDPMSVL